MEETFFHQLEAEDISPASARPAAHLTAKLAEELAKCGVNFSPERNQWIAQYWYDGNFLEKLQHNKLRVEKRMMSTLRNVEKLAVIGRIKNAELNSQDLDPKLREKVLQIYSTHSYVDDVLAFCDPNESIEEVTGALTDVAEKGGFKFKGWVKCGDDIETKLLGYVWSPSEDVLRLKLWFNISDVKRGMRAEPNLCLESLEKLREKKISKRQILMLQGQFFDPLCIFSPAVIKLR